MEDGYARTRLTYTVPMLNHYLVGVIGTAPERSFPFPFVLPPLQAFFDEDYEVVESTPNISIEDVQFSFDQRGEGAILGDGLGAVDAGLINYNGLDGVVIGLSLMEKRLNLIEATDTYALARELFSMELAASVALAGRSGEFNPFNLSSRVQLHPYRSYVGLLSVSGLYADVDASSGLPSLQVTFTIRHPLVTRSVTGVQNFPSNAGAKTGEDAVDVLPNVPAAGATITAGGDSGFPGTGTGIQANLQRLEELFHRRLKGGRYKDGGIPVKEHLLHDSAYEVIAVPMWGNANSTRQYTSSVDPPPPYSGASPHVSPTGVRVPIFLHYPLIIHHVFAAVSYLGVGTGVAKFPTSTRFTNDIAVVMGTGMRADFATYQDIATRSWTPATVDDKSVDRIKFREDAKWTDEAWDMDIQNVPLIGSNGSGYYAQGNPVYVGKASSRFTTRTDINLAAPRCLGLEQWLECRWTFKDTDGLLGGPLHPQTIGTEEVYVGFGGHWIILICEKAAIGGDRDVRV